MQDTKIEKSILMFTDGIMHGHVDCKEHDPPIRVSFGTPVFRLMQNSPEHQQEYLNCLWQVGKMKAAEKGCVHVLGDFPWADWKDILRDFQELVKSQRNATAR